MTNGNDRRDRRSTSGAPSRSPASAGAGSERRPAAAPAPDRARYRRGPAPAKAGVRTEEGKLSLFVAIDRTSKLAFARLETEANRHIASDFLRAMIEAVPYEIHTPVLTDNGQQFCHALRNRSGPTARYSRHMFDRVCDEHGIEHRLTKPNHPWTTGQVERMNRTLKDATVKRCHSESHDQLRSHLQLFLNAYNHARRLKTLRGLTPSEHVLHVWTKEPDRFRINPSHPIRGPYTWPSALRDAQWRTFEPEVPPAER